MTTSPITPALEAVYEGLHGDDLRALDAAILSLRSAMKENNIKTATFDPSRLAQNNREGRKRMQSYFKKRGVSVNFSN